MAEQQDLIGTKAVSQEGVDAAVQWQKDKDTEARQRERTEKRKRRRQLDQLNKLCVEFFMDSKDHTLSDSIIQLLAWAERRAE